MIPARVIHAKHGDGITLSGDVSGSLDSGMGTLRARDVVYCDAGTLARLPALVGHYGGSVIGGPGNVLGATVMGVSFLGYGSWGAENAADIARAAMDCAQARMKWHSTAGATVGANAPSRWSLPPRWRGLAHAAVYSGPIMHSRASGYGVHIDRNEAYLQSMESGEMPGDAGYFLERPSVREVLRKPLSIVTARVRVADTSRVQGLPPLPVRVAMGLAYPVGEFWGTWTGELLKGAVERGEAEILAVKWRATAIEKTRSYIEFAARLRELPKATRKPLYARLWGKMCARGGVVGTRERRPGTYLDGGLWWGRDENPLWIRRMSSYYRPDVAAFITSRNITAMVEAERTLAEGSFIGSYIDSIWSSDIAGCERLMRNGGWKMEGRGRVIMPGPGRYWVNCDDGSHYCGHAGQEDEPASAVELCAGTGNPARRRGWYGDPRTDRLATSVPPDATDIPCDARVAGYQPDSSVWDGQWLEKSFESALTEEYKKWHT